MLQPAFASETLNDDDKAANIEVPLIDPDIERRDINESEINVDDFEFGVFGGVLNIEDFGTSSLLGAKLTYHISETLFTRLSYGQSTAGTTSYERLSGGSNLLTQDEREFRYYDLGLGYSLNGETFITKDLTFNSATYFLLGAGSTEFAGDSRFTVSFTAGYRILLSDNFTLHFDMTDHVFDSDILGAEKTSHNLAFSLGFSGFF